MSFIASRPLRILSELKRRHVFKVAVAYMVGGWITVEVAATVFPVLDLPAWTPRMVVALVIAGFPIAVLLSWAYDLTPSGLVRTDEAPVPTHGALAAARPVALSPLIGRDREVADIMALLSRVRIVTVTGPGGTGKTRLAVEVLDRLAESGSGGPWMVELAGLQEPELAANAVADALGVVLRAGQTAVEALVGVLRQQRAVLVLDNCEHLASAIAQLAALLATRCPGVRILATSREPLRVAGESIYPLAPLPVTTQGPDGEVLDGPAIRLFEVRARAVLPEFRITPDNRSSVRAICHRVEGLPLALELSAARLRVLSPDQLAARLERSFDLLSDGGRDLPHRHQAMSATIEWSFNLLGAGERRLFMELSVFQGGFELDAVETVASDAGPGLLDRFGNLIDKSMLVMDAASEPRRFRMLESLRQYAWGHLSPVEAAELQDRHMSWCVALAEAADQRLRGPEAALWLGRLDRERHNLRAALGQALVTGQVVEALRVCGSLSWFWFRRGHVAEGRLWLDRVIQAAGESVHPPLAHALTGLAAIQYLEGDLAAAEASLERATLMAARFADTRIQARAMVTMAYLRAARGDLAAAERAAVEGRDLARAEGHREVETEAFTALGQISRAHGDLETAEALLLEGVAGAGAIGHHWQASSASWLAAKVALDRGDPTTAARRVGLCIERMWAEGDQTSTLVGIHTMAAALALLGEPRRGATLLGAVAAFGERIGYFPERMDPVDAARNVAMVRERLDPAAFHRAFQTGRSLTLEASVAMALAPVTTMAAAG
jgi:predicted ATPase